MIRIAATAVLVIATVALIGYPARSGRPAGGQRAGDVSTPAADASNAQPAVLAATIVEPSSEPAEPAKIQPAKAIAVRPGPAPIAASTLDSHKDFVPPAPPPPDAAAAGFLASSPVLEPARSASAADAGPSPEHASETAVTITGCLEETIDEARFRLSDTEGADAPRARGWRSGFLKKRPAPVELLEPPDTAMLRKYVGHRVTATGLLNNRQLRVKSVGAAGAACD
jgi:hypothetical protein